MKKIVIACDSFKGSLSSAEVATSAAEALHSLFPEARICTVEVADGGEGTAEVLTKALSGQWICASVSDPLGRPHAASYGIAGKTAILEMAAASGLPLLGESERNPLLTSTYGTGELIRDALARGCRKFYLGIGGSATNDGGMGMLAALGVRYLDESGEALFPGRGCDLERIHAIDLEALLPEARESEFIVACDVDTPFSGPEGAACVFAPQKGAGPDDVKRLDAGMSHFASLIEQMTGIDLNRIKGSGAAGGLGGACYAFLGARLESGAEMVLSAIGIDTLLENADLVITGEGKADFQTPRGKTAAGILRHARAAGIPALLIAGKVDPCPELDRMGFQAILPVTPEGQSLDVAMRPDIARENIHRTLTSYFQGTVPSAGNE